MATILIVDDLATNRKYLELLLRSEGHRLLEAADGRQALDVVHAARPDLVITDVLMPVMDGYEFVKQLRLDPAIAATPVVFCTAHYGEREARALARSSGVAHVLTKPAAAAEVLNIVHRLLSGTGDGSAAMADETAPAVEFDREHLQLLTDKLSEKAEDLRAANAQLRALVNIGLELGAGPDSEQLLRRVAASACDLFGATSVTLGILDRRDHTVQECVTYGPRPTIHVKAGDRLPELLQTVVEHRRTIRVNTTGDDTGQAAQPPLDPDVQALLAAPISSPAHVYGWICLVGSEGQMFTAEDENAIKALSGQIGRVYENAYFFEVAKHRTEALEREIAERQRVEDVLRHERDLTQRYLDTAEVILLALDAEARITLINRKGCDLLGWTDRELIGRDWTETCVPLATRPAAKAQHRRLLGGDLSPSEGTVITRTNKERLIEWRHTIWRDDAERVTGTFSSGTDVTDRRTLELQYQHAQKMEAVGRLAGGVAHDFNNLLTAILGNCELLLSDVTPGDPHEGDIAEIRKAGLSAAELTRQLLAFSRKDVIEPSRLDLNDVVTDMQAILERLIGEDVKVVMRLGPTLACVTADRGQLEQVVMNLAVNARDAMPKGGTLTIETANVELDGNYPNTHLGVTPGAYVALIVSDNGTGMTPEVQARVFEPFFTTKALGQGTGLGLATVHNIATKSGGSVNVYSEVGKGTAFKIYLPTADAATAPPDSRPAPARSSGVQTVLVVEDAEGPRDLARKLLQRQGYTVLVAANANEALTLFEGNGSVDVLLTDVVMPGASGPELTRQLVGRRPALKVVFMSGYTEETIVQHGVLDPGVAFLHKPFTADALGRKIREVLDA